MTSEELRELADVIEPMGQAPRFSYVNVPAACAYLRACADALEAGPVAMGWRSQDGEVADCISIEEAGRNGAGAYTVPLYPLAMPAQTQTLRLPEPMTDADMRELLCAADWRAGPLQDFARAIEAETLRRIKEVNK